MRRPSKLAILYPWGEIRERKSGASLRVSLLIDFLKNHLDRICVFSHSDAADFQEENIHYESYKPRRILGETASYRLFHLLVSVVTCGKNQEQDKVLWEFLRFRFDRQFRKRVEDIVRWADVVMLDYPYWGRQVIELCRQYNVPLILTAHDIHAEQVTGSNWLRRRVHHLEIEALTAADSVVCVSPTDQQVLLDDGVETCLIPNPIDRELFPQMLPDEVVRSVLFQLLDLDLQGKQVCLFVGSKFPANELAAEAMRGIAAELSSRREAEKHHFIVVGDCARPMRGKNYTALGRVDAFLLRGLYQLASLIVIPIEHGTGASLKTLEAMASGRAVLGTRAAFRGLAVDDGVHCLISDCINNYPEIILELLEHPENCTRVGENGRRFIMNYDYRSIFPDYLSLIGAELAEDMRISRPSPLHHDYWQGMRSAVYQLVEQENYESGRMLLEGLLEHFPEDGDMHYLLAYVLQQQGVEPRRALDHYDQAICHRYSHMDKAYFQKSRLLFQMGIHNEAADCLEYAINTSSLDGLKQFIWEATHKGEFESVQKMAGRLLDMEPRQGIWHYLKGLSLYSLNTDRDLALECYNRALDYGFDDFWVRFHRGLLLYERGQWRLAQKDLRKAVRCNPEYQPAKEKLAAAREAIAREKTNMKTILRRIAYRLPVLRDYHETGRDLERIQTPEIQAPNSSPDHATGNEKKTDLNDDEEMM